MNKIKIIHFSFYFANCITFSCWVFFTGELEGKLKENLNEILVVSSEDS